MGWLVKSNRSLCQYDAVLTNSRIVQISDQPSLSGEAMSLELVYRLYDPASAHLHFADRVQSGFPLFDPGLQPVQYGARNIQRQRRFRSAIGLQHRIVGQDLSDEHWQISREFRLASVSRVRSIPARRQLSAYEAGGKIITFSLNALSAFAEQAPYVGAYPPMLARYRGHGWWSGRWFQYNKPSAGGVPTDSDCRYRSKSVKR